MTLLIKKGTRKMKNFDIELFIKDLDKLFNDMQDKAIAGSENVATASWVIKQQLKEIEKLKTKTLTDEEIMVLYEEYIETQYASESNVLGFGRAILRKAQE